MSAYLYESLSVVSQYNICKYIYMYIHAKYIYKYILQDTMLSGSSS